MRLIDADQFGVVSFQGKSEDFIEGALFILDKIYDAPTVERHGEWVFDSSFTEFGNPYGTYKCSACGGHSANKYSFCKDCGASMVKEGEAE